MAQVSLSSVTNRDLIDSYMDAFLTRRIQAARDINPRYEALWREIMRVAGFGKRIRPLMMLQAYKSFGGTDVSRVVPAAVACELLHVSMLIHDDIIDRDLLRHGQPTIQAAYLKRYASEVVNEDDRNHNAISAAILAGDLLLSDARGLITKCEADEDVIRQAGYAFDQAVFEVAGGELLDVESVHAPRGSVDSIAIMTYKTASYSFIGPLVIGATLAGTTLANTKFIREFGLNLGIAYQLTDDILGIFGNSDITGKPNDGDIHEGKATYLVERELALAPSDEVETFQSLYGQSDLDETGCETIRTLLKASGALTEIERLIRTYVDRAKTSLDAIELSVKDRDAFESLITKATARTS